MSENDYGKKETFFQQERKLSRNRSFFHLKLSSDINSIWPSKPWKKKDVNFGTGDQLYIERIGKRHFSEKESHADDVITFVFPNTGFSKLWCIKFNIVFFHIDTDKFSKTSPQLS